MTRTSWLALSLFFTPALFAACADNGDDAAQGQGGTTANGGRTGSGGATSSGGSSAAGGSAGSPSGGRTGSGGTSSSSGSPGSGGATAAGGSAGSPSGGRTGSGGVSSSGGTPGSGGAPATGGSAGSPSGGRTGSGGTAGSSSGGRTGSGGSAGSSSGGRTGSGGSTHTGKWRIMPLGDSITETTCYPKLLSQKLVENGHANFEFVGASLNNQSCGTAPNVQTEGRSCYLVTNLVKDVPTVTGCGGTKGSLAELKTWAASKPEVVLMQYGTNDAWSSIATQTILDAYSFVLDQFRAQNPSIIFFVAQITPLNPSGCSNCEANVEALNAKIPAWASSKSTAASPVHVVNVWSALPAAGYTPNSSYTSDGCHPNQAGSQLMADKWYEGLTAQGIP